MFRVLPLQELTICGFSSCLMVGWVSYQPCWPYIFISLFLFLTTICFAVTFLDLSKEFVIESWGNGGILLSSWLCFLLLLPDSFVYGKLHCNFTPHCNFIHFTSLHFLLQECFVSLSSSLLVSDTLALCIYLWTRCRNPAALAVAC